MKASDGKSNMFDHMNTKNMTQVEMDQSRRMKKRKLNDTTIDAANESVNISKAGEFKEPAPVKKTA